MKANSSIRASAMNSTSFVESGSKKALPRNSSPRETGGTDTAVGLLTGGFDRPYAYGISTALAAKGLRLDVIGSDDLDCPEMHTSPGLNFLNLQRGWRSDASTAKKCMRVLAFYVRLIAYAATAKPKIFHILWNNKLAVIDRTLLMLFYRALGKKIVLTAHNVNTRKRDGSDSVLNRLTLRAQYKASHHIFVHTERMRDDLVADFGVRKQSVTVIPFGINNSLRQTDLSPSEAKRRIGVGQHSRAILFFGGIRPYKGLQYLVSALELLLKESQSTYRLIIAGKPKKEDEQYWAGLQKTLNREILRGHVLQRIEYIPDNETELYFKAADVVVLPYTNIYQSGVLFLGYSFGLPAVATSVGSFGDDIVEGRTGYLCDPCDPKDLARALETYFQSDLYRHLDEKRQEIRTYAHRRYSWDVVGNLTCRVYDDLVKGELR